MSIRGRTIVLSHRVSESWWPWGTRMIMADRGCWAQWLWPGPWYHCDDNYIQLPSSTYLAYQRNDIILGLEHQPVLTHVAAPSHAHAPLVVDHVVHPSLTPIYPTAFRVTSLIWLFFPGGFATSLSLLRGSVCLCLLWLGTGPSLGHRQGRLEQVVSQNFGFNLRYTCGFAQRIPQNWMIKSYQIQ